MNTGTALTILVAVVILAGAGIGAAVLLRPAPLPPPAPSPVPAPPRESSRSSGAPSVGDILGLANTLVRSFGGGGAGPSGGKGMETWLG